jgi:hypothetical protein
MRRIWHRGTFWVVAVCIGVCLGLLAEYPAQRVFAQEGVQDCNQGTACLMCNPTCTNKAVDCNMGVCSCQVFGGPLVCILAP